MRHVSGGINMDQHSDAGNKKQPDAGKRIEQEPGIGFESGRGAVMSQIIYAAGVSAKPRIQDGLIRLMEMFLAGRPRRVLPHRPPSHDKGQYNHAHANGADRSLLQLAAKKEHDSRAEGREQRYEPDVF